LTTEVALSQTRACDPVKR